MNASKSKLNRSAGGEMLHGSFWMILLRWTIRLTGLVSTIVLARLLTPSDFGVVAMAMIVVGMLEVLNQTGQKLAIIRQRDPSRDHYDAAWTISVSLGLLTGIAICIAAPFSALYFHDPRVVPVIQCLALRAVLGGFENIGATDFRRDLKFHIYFLYNSCPKIISFVVTVGLAVLWQNYWALVVGILVSQLSLTVLSYVMHPFRPRLSLKKFSDIGKFSAWTFMRSLGFYFNQQVDGIVIGGISGAASMGRYAVASDVSSSPFLEINDPMIAVLYPVMSRLQDDLDELRALYLRTVGWSTIICVSGSVGVALVAEQMVKVILGDKWLDVIPLMGWLALSGGILGVSSATYTLFDALGKPHLGARMQWVRVVMLAVILVPVGYFTHNLVAIAMARLAAITIFVPTLFRTAGNVLGIRTADYFHVVWRPIAAAIVMALVVTALERYVQAPLVMELLLKIAAGATTFGATLLALWHLNGRPSGPEQDIVSQIGKRLRFAW